MNWINSSRINSYSKWKYRGWSKKTRRLRILGSNWRGRSGAWRTKLSKLRIGAISKRRNLNYKFRLWRKSANNRRNRFSFWTKNNRSWCTWIVRNKMRFKTMCRKLMKCRKTMNSKFSILACKILYHLKNRDRILIKFWITLKKRTTN